MATTSSSSSSLGSVNSAYNSSQISSLVSLAIYGETSKVTLLQATQSKLTTTQSAISSVKSSLSALSSAVNNLMTAGAFDVKKVQSSDAAVLTSSVSSSASTGSYALNVTSLAASCKLGSSSLNDSGTTLVTAEGAGTKIFRIASGTTTEEISVDLAAGDNDNTALAKIMDAVNAQSSTAKASLIKETSGATTLVIEARNSGNDGAFTLEDGTGTLLQSAGVLKPDGSAARVLQAASDASFTIGGNLTITRSSNEISDGITGVTVNLLKLGTSTLTVSADTTTVANNLSTFVSAYNSAQSAIRTQLNEATDDSDPTKGVLNDNSQLRSLSNELRRTLAGSRDLAFSSLSALGIKPVDVKTASTENASNLTLDVAAFKAALQSDPSAVKELVTGTAGIFTQLKAGLDLDMKAPGGTLDALTTAATSRADLIAKRITEAQADVTKKTAYYTALYTSLAGQITAMQQQSSSFSNIYGNYYTASTTSGY